MNNQNSSKKPIFTANDEIHRLCEEWIQEPLINPKTGRRILKNGETYKMWQNKCKELGLEHKPKCNKLVTYNRCQEWIKNRNINPETGRKISSTGPTFKRYLKKCKNVERRQIEGEYSHPEPDGRIPCIKSNSRFYVIRKCKDGRRVWGPLNKYARGAVMHHFKDTWDFKNQYFMPIFIGKSGARKHGSVVQKQHTPKKNTKKTQKGPVTSKSFLDALITGNH